jgi:chitin disaccharide deacetylase
MRCIVVNGDDLGISPGVNQGIAEAHRQGVLTSASLMVEMPASREGAELALDLPALSVGLHADLTDVGGQQFAGRAAAQQCEAVLQRQLDRFQAFVGRLPTHLDSHHNVHRDPLLLPSFLKVADRHRLPLREHSPVRHVGSFYGQWNGETHLEQISVDGLIGLLETEIREGVTEIGCHPGYADPQLRSSYRHEREAELRTLCDPAVVEFLSARHIRLVDFAEAMDLLADAEPGRGTP